MQDLTGHSPMGLCQLIHFRIKSNPHLNAICVTLPHGRDDTDVKRKSPYPQIEHLLYFLPVNSHVRTPARPRAECSAIPRDTVTGAYPVMFYSECPRDISAMVPAPTTTIVASPIVVWRILWWDRTTRIDSVPRYLFDHVSTSV
jgi:hypothetical protein